MPSTAWASRSTGTRRSSARRATPASPSGAAPRTPSSAASPAGPRRRSFGQAQTQTPFGNGFLCIGPPQVRIEPPAAPVAGVATRTVDLALFGIVAGTYEFQYWYRDPAAGGAFFNLSDAVEVVFGP